MKQNINEIKRMQELAGLNEDLELKKEQLKKEIEGILYQYVDDINNARGISADDLEYVAKDIVNYIMDKEPS